MYEGFWWQDGDCPGFQGSYGSFSIFFAWKTGERSQKLAAFAGVPVSAVQLLLHRWRRLTNSVTSLPMNQPWRIIRAAPARHGSSSRHASRITLDISLPRLSWNLGAFESEFPEQSFVAPTTSGIWLAHFEQEAKQETFGRYPPKRMNPNYTAFRISLVPW